MPYIRCHKYKTPRTKVLEKLASINGSRHLIVRSNNKYIGEWKNNARHGYGNYESTKKKVYEGYWDSGLQEHFGVKSRKNNKNVNIFEYRGNWSKGVCNGYGEKIYKDHSFYKGGFKDGKKHGHGQMWFADGTFYDGEWQNGSMHGRGLRTYIDGKRYEGNFVDGLKEGFGIYNSFKKGFTLKGVWYKDVCVSNCMEEMQMKQSAPLPCRLPFPKLELQDYNKVYEERITSVTSKLTDQDNKILIGDL